MYIICRSHVCIGVHLKARGLPWMLFLRTCPPCAERTTHQDLWLTNQAQLTGLQAKLQVSACTCPLYWDSKHELLHLAFSLGSQDPFQDAMFAQQVHCPLGHLLSHWSLLKSRISQCQNKQRKRRNCRHPLHGCFLFSLFRMLREQRMFLTHNHISRESYS